MRGDPVLMPPFRRLGPSEPTTPLVIAVPHAGRYYPEAIDALRAVPRSTLEELEDRHADLLVPEAVAGGAVAIVATLARAWIDLNRGEEDRETASGQPGSARERVGLGLVPRRLAGQALWHEPVGSDAVAERLATVHRPYHAAVSAALLAARRRHGFALLIDCHSMPPLHRGRHAARIVLGDRHGSSAAPTVTDAVAAVASAHGIATARNAPYAGAHTLERHGTPGARVHAIQMEFDRSLYLDAGFREPSRGLPATAQLFAAMAWAGVAAATPGAMPLAAE